MKLTEPPINVKERIEEGLSIRMKQEKGTRVFMKELEEELGDEMISLWLRSNGAPNFQ